MQPLTFNPGKTYSIIGVMSGTSLDGVDIAHCSFGFENGVYEYKINACETVAYPAEWYKRLMLLPGGSALDFALTHVQYGKYLGKLVSEFMTRHHLTADYIACHGHTIFHQPGRMFTSQIGDGAALAAESCTPVICDFRSADVAHGGQGAPLVPIGDEMLFAQYSYCLNLGGFANISFRKDEMRKAFDICPVNFILNYLANQLEMPYDKDGEIAASGHIDYDLLSSLEALPYYVKPLPKSLGREWVEQEFLPLINHSASSISDKLSTVLEHIVSQIEKTIESGKGNTMLITGGGTYNRFLISRLRKQLPCSIHIPENELIDYKEALIFAFLGLLRITGKPNCLASVTGAKADVCGGAIYLP
jgi:anhydro-N-acetylmuramic acid kinase